ncbi:hypothetical protein NCU02698 [Neurospora crassa OR74A]|uniref:Uncharacterized protein n=2 Tax=Neurospora crassa TaxID=5141 RepID=Q7SH31_NEUCR|nr:hypothetical protein NCU02698 [Neurospora crassa OR74A]EAA36235.1 hypothetical protein NCU02698 [Neurospora crassa OR74A]CAE76513.1 hypothetical protein [Neurospora crassa]|eukprot:XP_965471.1 hypothetical protein NCU02698 [Neurospora crassa OR74A]
MGSLLHAALPVVFYVHLRDEGCGTALVSTIAARPVETSHVGLLSFVRFLGASSRETSLSNTALANGSSQSARMQDGECERQGQGAHFGSRRKVEKRAPRR